MPNRILRDWTDSERIEKLSPEAERLFVRLIMKADDFGRFHADARLVIAACLPLVSQVTVNLVNAWISDLVKQGLVKVYTSGNRKYLEIMRFHQRMRKMRSKFPSPDGQLTVNCQSSDGLDGDGGGDGGGGDSGAREIADTPYKHPSLEDCITASAPIGMTRKQVEAFYHHFDAVGWVDGQKRPIKSLPSALAKWKAREPNFAKADKSGGDVSKQYRSAADAFAEIEAEQKRLMESEKAGAK